LARPHVKLSFFKNGVQEGKRGPICTLVPVGVGKEVGKGCKRVNMVEVLCSHNMENGKMRPVETPLGMGRGE
jgi:hypothetical protein